MPDIYVAKYCISSPACFGKYMIVIIVLLTTQDKMESAMVVRKYLRLSIKEIGHELTLKITLRNDLPR